MTEEPAKSLTPEPTDEEFKQKYANIHLEDAPLEIEGEVQTGGVGTTPAETPAKEADKPNATPVSDAKGPDFDALADEVLGGVDAPAAQAEQPDGAQALLSGFERVVAKFDEQWQKSQESAQEQQALIRKQLRQSENELEDVEDTASARRIEAQIERLDGELRASNERQTTLQKELEAAKRDAQERDRRERERIFEADSAKADKFAQACSKEYGMDPIYGLPWVTQEKIITIFDGQLKRDPALQKMSLLQAARTRMPQIAQELYDKTAELRQRAETQQNVAQPASQKTPGSPAAAPPVTTPSTDGTRNERTAPREFDISDRKAREAKGGWWDHQRERQAAKNAARRQG